jgi:CHAT domain
VTTGGLAEVHWLEPATLEGLEAALRQDHHVLHYIGHSSLLPSGDSVLVLERNDGSSHLVSGSLLANMIGRNTQIRMAVLNSCASAAVVDGDPFSGIAMKLVALGIPAVVAMQYVVGDAAAVTFGSSLYRSLIDRERVVEDAVAEARLAVLSRGHEIDWVAPVVFVQRSEARLFDLSMIGWCTLDGSRPARWPQWGQPGFLGLTVSDPIERAMRLLGSDFDTFTDDTRIYRCWTFQGESRICVVEEAGSILELSASIDGDDHGGLRISLPYSLLLGESTMVDTLAIERLREPKKERSAPENLLSETWSYVCPDSGEGWLKIEFTTTTSAGREDPNPDWFSWDMDLSRHLVTGCRIAPRGTEFI